MQTSTLLPPAPGGILRCDPCMDGFSAHLGCERIGDLAIEREGTHGMPTARSRRSLRAHARACDYCRTEDGYERPDPAIDHHEWCEHHTPPQDDGPDPDGIELQPDRDTGEVYIIDRMAGEVYTPAEWKAERQDDQPAEDDPPTLWADTPMDDQIAEWIEAQGGTVTYHETAERFFGWRIREALMTGRIRSVTNAAWNYQLLTTRPDNDTDPDGGATPPPGNKTNPDRKEEGMNTNTPTATQAALRAMGYRILVDGRPAAEWLTAAGAGGETRNTAHGIADRYDLDIDRLIEDARQVIDQEEELATFTEDDHALIEAGLTPDTIGRMYRQELRRSMGHRADAVWCPDNNGSPSSDQKGGNWWAADLADHARLCGCGHLPNPQDDQEGGGGTPPPPADQDPDIYARIDRMKQDAPGGLVDIEEVDRMIDQEIDRRIRAAIDQDDPCEYGCVCGPGEWCDNPQPIIHTDPEGREWLISPYGASPIYDDPALLEAEGWPTGKIAPIHWWASIAEIAGAHLAEAITANHPEEGPPPHGPPAGQDIEDTDPIVRGLKQAISDLMESPADRLYPGGYRTARIDHDQDDREHAPAGWAGCWHCAEVGCPGCGPARIDHDQAEIEDTARLRMEAADAAEWSAHHEAAELETAGR